MADLERLADDVIEACRDFIGRALAPIRKELAELVETAAALDRRLSTLPAGTAGAPGKDGERGPQGDRGEKGADGVDGKDGVAGRDGLPGRDGLRGQDGADGADGHNGIDGKDGLGFDDMSVEYDGERTFKLKFQQGERTKEFAFKMPIVLDRGVFKQDGDYERGDGVTYGGSWHIAQKDAPQGKPGLGGDWRLAVKRGQDGRDGKLVEDKGQKVVRLV